MRGRLSWLPLLAACGAPREELRPEEAPPEALGGVPDDDTGDSGEDPSWKADYDALFDLATVGEIRLTLQEDALEALRDAPRTYVPAVFEHAGVVRTDVGVRLKGNNSYRDLDEKPAFRVRFGAYDASAGRYAGLERLALNNLVNDPAQGREVVAYWAWNAAGLPAPRASFVRLRVNGEDHGLYAALEPIDGTWAEKRWEDGGGDVWEANDSADLTATGVAHFELAAGEGDRERLASAARALAATGVPFASRADDWLDLDAFLSYWAWTMAVGNLDGYPYNLDDYFLYANPSDGSRYVFAPWGLDETWDTGWRWQWGRGAVSYGCADDPACLLQVQERLADALSTYEVLDVAAQADALFALTEAVTMEDPRSPYTPAEVQAARTALLGRMATWPDTVRASVWPSAPTGGGSSP
jgi:hypothetical protein